jgi:restriction system protein
MAIPDYQTLMLPLLKYAAQKKQITLRDCEEHLSTLFDLTTEERTTMLPSGNQQIMTNRVGWARTYLKKAGLLNSPKRGLFEISQRGRDLLEENPNIINVKLLKRYPEFLEFQKPSDDNVEDSSELMLSVISEKTPEENLLSSVQELRSALESEMLERVKSCSPKFFEILVVDVLVKMGYGGSLKEAGKAIGQSGDEGVDGIINEDRLGLDVIYIQAKRWDSNIGRPEIQKFAGALQGKRARKGVFITTSDFTSEAKDFVKHIESKIILLSGRQLASLMWEHGVGVGGSIIYEVKRIDQDFFTES